jgi:fatty-acyl-CoA synthase
MYHCFGMVMGNLGALCHGASIVYPAPSFDAQKTLQAMAQEKCTSIFAVPTMFTQMVEEHGSNPPIPSLRTGLMAGSSCPEKLMLQVHCSLLARFDLCVVPCNIPSR